MSMISSYLTDKIALIAVTQNEWGVITETELDTEPARVEDKNELILDSDGKEVRGKMLILLDKDSIVTYDYKIKVKEKNGFVFDQPNKKFQIKYIDKLGMRRRRFIAVWV